MTPRRFDADFEYKLVVVIRDDLKLSPGKLSVQVAHASVSCAMKAKSTKTKIFNDWFSEGQRKIVLKVGDLKELEDIEKKAKSKGLMTEKIMDAGLTEVPPGTITCLGIGPARAEDVDKVTGHLKLA